MKAQIESGITIDKIKYKPAKMEIIDQKKSNFWIKIKLTEGKNREIRKIMEHFNLRVSRLIRIAYGDFNLGKLKLIV